MTLVFLMAVRNSSHIAGYLLSKGWAPNTGIALVFGATTNEQVAWKGTIQELVNNPDVIEVPATHSTTLGAGKLPGTLIVGEVVNLSDQLAPETTWLNHESSEDKRQWAQQGG
jgi:siroheme synthase